jgi:Tfp pilus assembly protein PilO
MRRQHVALAVLAAILLVVLFWLLLWQPQRAELTEVEEQIAAQQQQQQQLGLELQRLRMIREEAPEVEAQLAAAEAVLPRSSALPSALRQLQLAADESGVVLQSLSASPPTQLPNASEGLSSIDVTLQLAGGYFQLVDFLRRVEDPSITPRGLRWGNATLTRGEYPTINIGLGGRMFAELAGPPPPPPEEQPATGEDADIEIEIETEDG